MDLVTNLLDRRSLPRGHAINDLAVSVSSERRLTRPSRAQQQITGPPLQYRYAFSAAAAQRFAGGTRLAQTLDDMITNSNSVTSAADRYFRSYEAHCVQPDVDTLFNLLNALHSLHDKLQKFCAVDFFAVNEFVALQALRNLFHHKEELLSEVRVVATQDLPPLITDSLFLCLIPRSLVELAIAEIGDKRRVQDEPVIRAVLKWYGNVVNINPCILNFSVHVFEKCEELGLDLTSRAYEFLKSSYEFEAENEYSHFITGDISCHAGSVDAVISTVFVDVV